MKRTAVTAVIILQCFCVAQAQTFLDRLKKPTRDKAVVTVTQDAAIDKLVNSGNIANGNGTAKRTTPAAKGEKSTTTPNTTNTNNTTSSSTTTEEPDMSKKVMRNSYKVTGYRVQAFAGGNTRKDRQNAEAIGNAIKRKFPEQPIYVHFYSPRWICRVGNFRTYEEAHAVLTEIRAMGYKQASIVKGKISVQY